MANNFNSHPAIQRMPTNQREWIDFILAMQRLTGSSDQVSQAEFTAVIPSSQSLEGVLKDAQIEMLLSQLMGRVGELEKELNDLRLEKL